jgi:ubiquitin-like protein Pup
MSMQERVHQSKTDSPTTDTEVTEVASTRLEGSERLKDELDDLLDEIDEVLETNAEEFVKNYVQKGGE